MNEQTKQTEPAIDCRDDDAEYARNTLTQTYTPWFWVVLSFKCNLRLIVWVIQRLRAHTHIPTNRVHSMSISRSASLTKPNLNRLCVDVLQIEYFTILFVSLEMQQNDHWQLQRTKREKRKIRRKLFDLAQVSLVWQSCASYMYYVRSQRCIHKHIRQFTSIQLQLPLFLMGAFTEVPHCRQTYAPFKHQKIQRECTCEREREQET